jgi:endonuclease/exonuclease/phosphatase family metal-dependent hydrolase
LCNTIKPGLSPEELANVPPPLDCYDIAQRKNNMLVWVRVKCTETGDEFCVATYHMPCEFRKGAVMTIHAAAIARLALRLSRKPDSVMQLPPLLRPTGDDVGASEENQVFPYILCGDFNIKPTSPQYQLLTSGNFGTAPSDWKGEFDESWEDHIPETPPYDVGYAFESNLGGPLVSAYRACMGAEPDFTNNVINTRGGKPEETFIETIDYIFCSKNVEIVGVQELPHRNAVADKGPLPWASEPSDHLPVCATIRV